MELGNMIIMLGVSAGAVAGLYVWISHRRRAVRCRIEMTELRRRRERKY